MVQRSAFTPDEIRQMLLSDDVEDQGVAARNLWAFWKGWQEDVEGSNEEEKEEKVRKQFADLAPRLHDLLRKDIEKAREADKYQMLRHMWHYLISLGCLQYPEALGDIHGILIDLSVPENVRGFAADSLTRYRPEHITDEMVEDLWRLALEDHSLPVRVNSIRALATKYRNSKNASVSKKFWENIVTRDDINAGIISVAVAAIGEVGSTEIVPDLIHMMITRRTGALKKDAALALDKIAEHNGMKNRDDLIKSLEQIE